MYWSLNSSDWSGHGQGTSDYPDITGTQNMAIDPLGLVVLGRGLRSVHGSFASHQCM